MFRFYLKRFCLLVMATLVACVCFSTVYVAGSCRLSSLKGERTFYLYSPSSQAQCLRSIDIVQCKDVRGESVCFEISAMKIEGDTDAFAIDVGGMYGATFLFCEKSCGVTSYYFYAPTLYEGVRVNGQTVNLHVAVSDTQCAVGSPIIFGGF